MSVALRPARPPRPLAALVNRLGTALLTVAAGVVLGLQYIMPNKRVIPVLVAIVMFGVAWRLDMVTALGVMAIALPFPRVTIFGNTNLAFILLLLVLWLLRFTQRQSAPPRRTPLDAPTVALFMAYVVSFYNITSATDLGEALLRLELIAASILAYFLVVANLQSDRDFHRFLNFQAVSVLLVCLVALFELTQPGRALFPGWISFGGAETGGINVHGARVGSVFYDFELLSEYCAVNGLMILFLLLRAQSTSWRVAYGLLLLLDVFVLFTTVTRGAFIALGAGALYLLWIVRRRLNFVILVVATAAALGVFLGMNFYVSNFTRSGSILYRLGATTFVGYMPDSRVGAWTNAWERIFEHPFIGHGPYYSAQTGTRTWLWPHCLYLFVANNVGFIGLAIFLWLMLTLFWVSRPRTDDVRHASLAEGYLVIGHVQLVVFLIDQIKIEYLRNRIYPFQVWLMFAMIVAAYQISRQRPLPRPAAAGTASSP